MKKSKLTLSIMASLLTTMSLAGCSEAVTKGKDGYILTLTNSSGAVVNVTADELFDSYYNDVSGVKNMFDVVYELYVRNHWNDPALKAKLKEIQSTAKIKVKNDKDTANDNTSSTKSYEEALQEILDEKGVENLKELYSKYEYELMKEKYEEDFYKNRLLDLRDGFTFGQTTKAGYLKEKIPYHVKHILVNVDADGSALYNGEISQANAKKLSSVVKIIAENTGTEESAYSFGQLALEQSDDTTSAATYGDLGVMDKDTSFINEFKLGIYAFDAIHNKETVDNKDLIDIPEEQEEFFKTDTDAVIGQIPYDVFVELGRVAEMEKDSNGWEVNSGKAFFFPRNIYFNKYLNNHRVSVIVPNNLPTADQLYQPDATTGKATGTEAYVGEANATYAALPGFQAKGSKLQNINWINNTDGKVLCDETGNVILVVRGGGSNYQGVHFIAVERSALQETVTKIVDGNEETISLSEYYTPYYEAQKNLPEGVSFPTYSNGQPKDVFVNKFNSKTTDQKARAEKIEGYIKNYDSNMSTYIYELLAEQDLQFHGEEGVKIQNAIDAYIKSVRENSDFNALQTWEQTWKEYMEYIQNQTAQRSKDKLLSATCAVDFEGSHDSSAWKKGGMCGYDDGK